MSGTFSSLSNALSALRYNRVAMDVASGNVANAGTEGYTRRSVVAQSVGAPAVPAMWSRWDGAAAGVEVGGIERMSDPFLDMRARTEHGRQSYLDARATSLVRVESTLGEPGDNGIAAALAQFKAGWHDVANNPDDGAARSQVLARGESLVSVIRSQARSVNAEWDNQHARLEGLVTDVNVLAGDLARLNDSIRVANNAGTDTGTLLDQRDQLSLRLAELTGGTTDVQPDGTANVRLGDPTNGPMLVSGGVSTNLVLGGPTSLDGVTATSMVTVTLDDASTTAVDSASVVLGTGGTQGAGQGEMGAAVNLMNHSLPNYLDRLDGFVTEMAGEVNLEHGNGYDPAGTGGTPFFAADPAVPPATTISASNIRVNITDPDLVAAASANNTVDGDNASAIAELDMGGDHYRTLVTNFGAEVASAGRLSENQSVLTGQIDGAREAVSGISIDEEMVALLAAQRAYEGAARVMTAIDSMLDTLINRTGLR